MIILYKELLGKRRNKDSMSKNGDGANNFIANCAEDLARSALLCFVARKSKTKDIAF